MADYVDLKFPLLYPALLRQLCRSNFIPKHVLSALLKYDSAFHSIHSGEKIADLSYCSRLSFPYIAFSATQSCILFFLNISDRSDYHFKVINQKGTQWRKIHLVFL